MILNEILGLGWLQVRDTALTFQQFNQLGQAVIKRTAELKASDARDKLDYTSTLAIGQ